MRIGYHRRRLADFAAGFRLAAKALTEHERWPKERLRRHQQERLQALIRHAVAHSPFYRSNFRARSGAVPSSFRACP